MPPSPNIAFSLSHFVEVVKRYRAHVMVASAAAALLYAAAALLFLFLSPSVTTVTLPFRLQFAGIETGTYPNGTRFSTSDIINTPVLERVYDKNHLNRFLAYADFKDRIFILESNRAIDILNQDYQSRLADAKLTSLDRDRLQHDYDLKLASIVRSEYTINFSSRDSILRVPRPLVEKTLADLLLVFAERAMRERGGLDYRIPIVTSHIFDDIRPEESPDLPIATDMLRTKISETIRVVDRLQQIPGAEVLRTEKDQVSLFEIRSRLEDLLRFDVQPLTNALTPHDSGESVARNYFLAQIEFNEARAAELHDRQSTYEAALATYLQPRALKPSESSVSTNGPRTTPYVSENFVDKVVQLSTQNADIAYRQKLVNSISEQGLAAAPYTEEVTYYKKVLSESGSATFKIEPPAARARLTAIRSEAVRTVDQVTEIYRQLSRNLNPGNVMITTTAPAYTRTVHAVSVSHLVLSGVLAVIFTILITYLVCLLHNRVLEEDAERAITEAGMTASDNAPSPSGF